MTERDERRRIILQAAERLMEHYGLTKTTVADIAREAAIGVGSVYLEFGSKDDIIAHVSGARHRAMLAQLEELAGTSGDVSARLRAVLDARVRIFRQFATCGAHARELVHCGHEPVQTSWRAYRRAEFALVERLLGEGVARAEFDVADTQRAARAVLDAYASFAPPWRFEETPDEEGRLLAMHELVLRGLRR